MTLDPEITPSEAKLLTDVSPSASTENLSPAVLSVPSMSMFFEPEITPSFVIVTVPSSKDAGPAQ